MKNLIYIIIGTTFFMSSCVKFPNDRPGTNTDGLEISEDFDWKTIETQTVSSTGVFSVINQDGDTIASNLPSDTRTSTCSSALT